MVAHWNRIDDARRKSGISQKEMAKRVGVSDTAVQKWKNGGTISAEKLVALAGVLNTTPEFLSESTNLHLAIARDNGGLSVREAPAAYVPCRIPESCDLPARLDAMQAQLADMAECKTRLVHVEAQLSTLLGLLGGALHHGLKDAPPRKAG